MRKLFESIKFVLKGILLRIWQYISPIFSTKKGFGKNIRIDTPVITSNHFDNVIIGDNSVLNAGSIIYATGGKFIMKKNSGAAYGLTVVTGNHKSKIGSFVFSSEYNEKDVLVEEDVWLGSNVTLLPSTIVGRGAIIGAGCVIRGQKVPPYSIVVGNPAKVVGFRFTPEDTLEHEKLLYPEEERLSLEMLEKNYKKYFLDCIDNIKKYNNLRMV